MGGSAGSSYCPNCGEELSSSANFCPNCGARNDGRTGRTSVSDRDVLEYRISKAMESGWELEHDFGDHAVMIRRDVGDAATHLLIGLLTLWWTMGMGNVCYAAYRYLGAPDRIVLRADQVENSRTRSQSDGNGATNSWWGVGLTASVLWLGAAIMTAFAGSVDTVVFTVFFAMTAALLALGGVGVLPPVRKRLANRRSVTANGWVRSVDERSVTDPDEPCTGCARPIASGVERTYKKELCLLGLPLSTVDGGTNHYCRRCANADRNRAGAMLDTGGSDGEDAAHEPETEGDLETDTESD